MLTTAETAARLQSWDNILILTHIRPDGDTVGCAAGLCIALRQLGKTAYVLRDSGTSDLFTPYLEGLTAEDGWQPEKVVAVDIAASGMFHEAALPYLDRVDLTIDHHPSQEFYAKETCLEGKRAACGEIVYDTGVP